MDFLYSSILHDSDEDNKLKYKTYCIIFMSFVIMCFHANLLKIYGCLSSKISIKQKVFILKLPVLLICLYNRINNMQFDFYNDVSIAF